MKKFVINMLSICLLGGMMAGCKSQKSAVEEYPSSSTTEIGIDNAETSTDKTAVENGSMNSVAVTNLNSRYTLLTESWKQWRDVEMGLKISLTSPIKQNASAKAYMSRDKYISISIKMLGFEFASLWMDNDSIVVIDKYHKKYLSEPTASVLGSSNITIADIQDLLLGRAFIVGHGTATTADRTKFDFEQADNGWYILPHDQPEKFNYGFLASLTANALRGTVIDVKDFGTVQAYYSDIFESRTCGWFAQEVNIENSKGKKVAATLKWDLNSSKFNAGINKSCRIPEKYERITMQQLNAILKNLN
jgi:hypothetical protein